MTAVQGALPPRELLARLRTAVDRNSTHLAAAEADHNQRVRHPRAPDAACVRPGSCVMQLPCMLCDVGLRLGLAQQCPTLPSASCLRRHIRP